MRRPRCGCCAGSGGWNQAWRMDSPPALGPMFRCVWPGGRRGCPASATCWSPRRPLPRVGIVLVNPGVAVSTQAVFRARAGAFSDLSHGCRRMTGGTPHLSPRPCVEHEMTLKSPARQFAPGIGEALDVLRRTPDCLLARMSGSGATCFGLFPSPAAARTAARTIIRERMVGLGRRAYRRIAVPALRERPGDLSRGHVGASPSGKATDFDSVIRRFDPSRPSQSAAPGGSWRGAAQLANGGFDILPALEAR